MPLIESQTAQTGTFSRDPVSWVGGGMAFLHVLAGGAALADPSRNRTTSPPTTSPTTPTTRES